MTNDAKVRVRLDTRQAKGDLKSMTTEAARTAKRVGGRIRGAVGGALGAVGLGGGIATGMAAVKGATASGFGDALSESFGGIGAMIERKLLGDKGSEARADSRAREETINAFAAVAGHTGKIPAGAKSFFDQVRTLRLEEEKGKKMFEEDERFRSVSLSETTAQILDGLKEIGRDMVNELWELIKGG